MAQNVLVIGSGGREHALCWKLAQSPQVNRVFAAPGSDGIGLVATCLEASSAPEILSAVGEHDIELVVVGPELPLVNGLADELRAGGAVVFGPGRDGARLEGDKAFAKEFLESAGVPTAQSESFDDRDAALAYVRERSAPCVVKATGLAAGKGVLMCPTVAEAEAAIRSCMDEAAFGEAGDRILVEEMLEGPELSIFAVLDGRRMAYFAASRDHKRIGEGDTGPNTGGMGAYTPVADATGELMARVVREALQPSLTELRRRGIDYRGLLYVGLMLTATGPKVLEFNCRFGDPETQVVLPAYDGDLYELLSSAARAELCTQGPLPRRGAAVGLVLASAGYPVSAEKGVPVTALFEGGSTESLVFHAGTRRVVGESQWLTNGGRVLCAVAQGDTVSMARAEALRQAESLRFSGAQLRRDIAAQEA
jgi:phosphoribosylamine---glycine ligase